MASLISAFRGGSKLKFSVKEIGSAFADAFDSKGRDIAKVNTDAMREVEKIAKEYARDSVRGGGAAFQGRWPRAVRSQTYPKSGTAMGPAALIWVRSEYAGIFETGGTITGKPWLWLPLPGVPAYYQRKRIRPGLIRGLVAIHRPGKPPMLGLRVKGTDARLKGPITTSLLSRGTLEGSAKKRGQKTKFRVIPLFIGIRTATLKKRWNVTGAVAKAGRQLPSKIISRLRG